MYTLQENFRFTGSSIGEATEPCKLATVAQVIDPKLYQQILDADLHMLVAIIYIDDDEGTLNYGDVALLDSTPYFWELKDKEIEPLLKKHFIIFSIIITDGIRIVRTIFLSCFTCRLVNILEDKDTLKGKASYITTATFFLKIHYMFYSYASIISTENAYHEQLSMVEVTNSAHEPSSMMAKCGTCHRKDMACCLRYRGDVSSKDGNDWYGLGRLVIGYRIKGSCITLSSEVITGVYIKTIDVRADLVSKSGWVFPLVIGANPKDITTFVDSGNGFSLMLENDFIEKVINSSGKYHLKVLVDALVENHKAYLLTEVALTDFPSTTTSLFVQMKLLM
ncbi:hypothetical protein PTKIN_Ptkin02bG0123600 [Pterospermum kingtungense]